MPRAVLIGCAFALSSAQASAQQSRAEEPVLRAHTLTPGAPLKMFVPSGTVQLIGWDRDSIVVRGRVPAPARLLMGGSSGAGFKIVIDQRDDNAPVASRLTIYVPRTSQVSLKTVDAVTTATDVGGWFYTVSGSIRLTGTVSTIDAEAMSGDIDLDATTPWARAKTGKGHLVIRGAPQDVDASTISGDLDVGAATIAHGRFTSVSGDIQYAAAMSPRSLFEFSNHSGAVDLLLPHDVSARFELSSVEGGIDNGFVQLRPTATGVHNLQLSLGSGSANVTVRTFKGMVRLRSR
jgi:putative adhesin